MVRRSRGRHGVTLTAELTDRLRTAIVHGELRPNQRLVEADLAASLAVSRTPIREALALLEDDGLVRSDRHGWKVHEHTSEEIRESFEVRIALEGYAVRLAAERRTELELQAIGETLVTDPATLTDPDPARRVDVNSRFHDAIVRASHNQQLGEIIRRNRLNHFNFQLAALYSVEDMRASLEQHNEILDAIRDGDANVAEQRTRDHLGTALATALDKLILTQQGDGPSYLIRR